MSSKIAILVAAGLGTLMGLGPILGVTNSAFSGATGNAGNTFQAASSFCTNPGTQTLTPDGDAYVDQLLPALNFGTDATLRVRSQLLGNQRTLVRFVLPAIPSRCTVTLAILRLNASSSAEGRTLRAEKVATSWTETGVNWLNQPASGAPAADSESGTGWVEWTVTSAVLQMYTGTNDGFLLRDLSEDSAIDQAQVFSSREGANPPELVITFS